MKHPNGQPTKNRRTNNTNAITHGIYSSRIDPVEAYGQLCTHALGAIKRRADVELRKIARQFRDLGSRQESVACRVAANEIESQRTGKPARTTRYTMGASEFAQVLTRMRTAAGGAAPHIMQLCKLQSLIEQGRLVESAHSWLQFAARSGRLAHRFVLRKWVIHTDA